MSSSRWLWPSIQRHDRFLTVREQDHVGATSTRQLGVENGDCCNSCLDAEMHHTGGMAEEAGCWGKLERTGDTYFMGMAL